MKYNIGADTGKLYRRNDIKSVLSVELSNKEVRFEPARMAENQILGSFQHVTIPLSVIEEAYKLLPSLPTVQYGAVSEIILRYFKKWHREVESTGSYTFTDAELLECGYVPLLVIDEIPYYISRRTNRWGEVVAVIWVLYSNRRKEVALHPDTLKYILDERRNPDVLMCADCGFESGLLSEVSYYDINGYPITNETDMERNSGNPDALYVALCTECAETHKFNR